MNHEEIEQRCLDEAKRLVGFPDGEPMYRKRFTSVALDGRFPRTRVVITGEYLYGGEWTISFPVWHEHHAISPREEVEPNYRRFISYLDFDVRER